MLGKTTPAQPKGVFIERHSDRHTGPSLLVVQKQTSHAMGSSWIFYHWKRSLRYIPVPELGVAPVVIKGEKLTRLTSAATSAVVRHLLCMSYSLCTRLERLVATEYTVDHA